MTAVTSSLMLVIPSESYKMGDNIRPQDQLAAVQGDFGSVPELFNQRPVDIDHSAEKEKHRLIHQIALSNLSQQVLGDITPQGKELMKNCTVIAPDGPGKQDRVFIAIRKVPCAAQASLSRSSRRGASYSRSTLSDGRCNESVTRDPASQ